MNFFVLLLILFGVLSYSNKDKLSRSHIIIYEILVCTPLLWFASFRDNFRFMGDTLVYVRLFENIPLKFSVLIDVCSVSGEYGYYLLQYICKIFYNNINFFFFVAAFLVLFLISWTFKKYSCNYLFSMFLFVFSNGFYAWICNGLRQGIAAAIIFASFPFMLKKKYIYSILFVLIAWTFHHSALIFLPFIFICAGNALNNKTIIWGIFVILCIFCLEEFTGFIINSLGAESRYGSELQYFLKNGRGMNVLSFFFLGIPTFIALLFINKIRRIDDPLLNLSVNMSFVSSLFYLFAVFAGGLLFGRIPVYFQFFNLLLLPWELKYLFDKKLRLILTFVFVLFYLIYCLCILLVNGILLEHHIVFFK